MQRTATIVRLSGPRLRRPGRVERAAPRLAVWLGVVGIQVVPLFVPARVLAQDVYRPHETPPTGEWIKTPQQSEGPGATAGLDGHVGYVERDGYVSVQVNVDLLGRNIVGDAANEPSIAINPTDPRKMAIGWRQFDSIESDFRQAGYGFSHDGGQTWTFPGSLAPGLSGSDPVLDSDAQGNLFYLSINSDEHDVRLFKSTDQGATWSRPRQIFSQFYYKPWMIIDRVAPHDPPFIYLTLSAGTLFSQSINGGLTFSDPFLLPLGFAYSSIVIDRAGALYLTDQVHEGVLTVLRTNISDGATPAPTIDMHGTAPLNGLLYRGAAGHTPNPGGLISQVWIDTDLSTGPYGGNVYCVALVGGFDQTQDSADVVFDRSEDSGETWSDPVRINDDPPSLDVWQWFDTMSVAPNGRIDVIWNDTRNFPDEPDARVSELFYSYSTDGGRTWSKNTPVSPAFDSYVGWPYQQSKLGDYYHMRSDNLGVNLAYAATFNGEQDIWFLRIGPHDCNANEVPDETDIRRNTSRDRNDNGIPDECELFGDFNGDSRLDLRDYQGMQLCFGAPSADLPGPRCSRLDLDLNSVVNFQDFQLLWKRLLP